ncbi:MAG: metal-dependent transcriptional regulator [Anaerorhabdus sp.]
MKIQESAEMYMETILILENDKESVRSIDIVNYLNYSKPSVSRAMKSLSEEGYINVDKKGFITLSDKGREIALSVYEKHQILTRIFISIGVSEENAKVDACRIEHCISDETFQQLREHFNQ